jgi:hypothetical protein
MEKMFETNNQIYIYLLHISTNNFTNRISQIPIAHGCFNENKIVDCRANQLTIDENEM